MFVLRTSGGAEKYLHKAEHWDRMLGDAEKKLVDKE